MTPWLQTLLRRLALLFAVLLLLGIVTSYGLYKAAQREPEFYREALEVEIVDHQEAGAEMEREVLDLHNELRDVGEWEAVFTEDQVNGWLASDLPRKFPRMLPPGTRQPRVSIQPDAIRVACRYEQGKVKTVISFAVDVDLTTEANTLALRVHQLRAGVLPVPLKQFLDPISRAAETGDVPVRWSQADGDPVALVTIPTRHEEYKYREIYLESVEVRDGAVYLAGKTEPQSGRIARQSANSATER